MRKSQNRVHKSGELREIFQIHDRKIMRKFYGKAEKIKIIFREIFFCYSSLRDMGNRRGEKEGRRRKRKSYEIRIQGEVLRDTGKTAPM